MRDTRFKEKIFDSKSLSAKRRLAAYYEILDKAIVGLGLVDHYTIDVINIYRATILAMQQAIRNLQTLPDFLLIDGNIPLDIDCPQLPIIDGDKKSLSIAAASIVAKVTRDNIMHDYDRLYPRYEFARHKGYGTRLHFLKIKSYGPCPIHRFSFFPFKVS